MKQWIIGLGGLLLAMASSAKTPAGNDLIVHEWGTFLAMNGSDGVLLDGMYHEEHALPAFVHARSKDQLRLHSALIKGETPVIYFYTPRRQQVNVRVDFPKGIWTQWYPQAAFVGPSLTAAGSPPKLRNGHIEWDVEVNPDIKGSPAPRLPGTENGALWNYSREVDAAYVRATDSTQRDTANEAERFIFYRGLGSAPLPVQMKVAGDDSLSLSAAGATSVKNLFILRVENGKGAFSTLPSLTSGEHLHPALPSMEDAKPLPEFTQAIGDALAKRLVESGLYPKEARAMVNTWRTSYFHNDGIRVLFILPQEWTDRFIPMHIDPKPAEVVRVMVGRVELLTPQREKEMEKAVLNLSSPEEQKREAGFAFLRGQGRYAEPVLRRVMQTTRNAKVKSLCNRLLLSEFVTEIRSAVNSSTDGSKIVEKPVHLRAQLVSLLREIGMEKEAKAEAERILPELKAMPVTDMDDHATRHPLRSMARAMEGMGDDSATLQAYDRLIAFGSGVKKCGGCHTPDGPKNMAWFRDWWAGKKYADYASRTGQTEPLIRQQERLLQSGDDIGPMMKLAYLYGAEGDGERADRLWARVESSDRTRTAQGVGSR